MQIESPETCVGDLSEAECRARVGSLFRQADIHEHWPLDSETAVVLLRDGGRYDVNLNLLEQWARGQSVGRVPIHAGKFAWTPENLLTAAALANASRLWLLDGKHISKMSGAELADLQARAVGESLFSDLDDVDIRALVGVISGTADQDLRSTLCLGLIAKLRKDGVVQ